MYKYISMLTSHKQTEGVHSCYYYLVKNREWWLVKTLLNDLWDMQVFQNFVQQKVVLGPVGGNTILFQRLCSKSHDNLWKRMSCHYFIFILHCIHLRSSNNKTNIDIWFRSIQGYLSMLEIVLTSQAQSIQFPTLKDNLVLTSTKVNICIVCLRG